MLRDHASPLDLGEQVVRGTRQPPTGNGKPDEVPVIFLANGYPGLKVVFAHGVHCRFFRMISVVAPVGTTPYRPAAEIIRQAPSRIAGNCVDMPLT
jgi:hypothetical protein